MNARGVPTVAYQVLHLLPIGGGYLPWTGGTYLGQGVPTLEGGTYLGQEVPTLGRGIPTWTGGCLPWMGGGTYLAKGRYPLVWTDSKHDLPSHTTYMVGNNNLEVS